MVIEFIAGVKRASPNSRLPRILPTFNYEGTNNAILNHKTPNTISTQADKARKNQAAQLENSQKVSGPRTC
jgi:hypothetical protein